MTQLLFVLIVFISFEYLKAVAIEYDDDISLNSVTLGVLPGLNDIRIYRSPCRDGVIEKIICN